jgi:hypothetical protein
MIVSDAEVDSDLYLLVQLTSNMNSFRKLHG